MIALERKIDKALRQLTPLEEHTLRECFRLNSMTAPRPVKVTRIMPDGIAQRALRKLRMAAA